MTFSEKFCAMHGIAPDKYEKIVLARSLYPQARLLRPLLGLFRDFLAPDRELVRGVGRIKRLREFDAEAQDFTHHPGNHGFFRQRLRLRASTRRLRELVRVTLRAGDTSAHPFASAQVNESQS